METTQNATNAMETTKEVSSILWDVKNRAHEQGSDITISALLGLLYQNAAGANTDMEVVRILGVDSIETSIIKDDEIVSLLNNIDELLDYALSDKNFDKFGIPSLPREIKQLVMQNILHVSADSTVYLPFARILDFVDVCPSATYVGEEENILYWALGKVRSFFKHTNVHISLGNSLDATEKYNTIVAFPPFGVRREDMSIGSIIESLYNRLADGGRMAIIVPSSFLTDPNVKSQKIKRMLLENHALESAVLLPGELLYSSSIRMAILVVWKTSGMNFTDADGNDFPWENAEVVLKDYSEFVKDNRKFGSVCKLDLEAIADAEKTVRLHEMEETTPETRFQIRMKTEELLHYDSIDLNPRFYLSRVSILQQQEKGQTLMPLSALSEVYTQANLFGGGSRVPMVQTSDLADTILKGKKDFSELESEERKEKNLPLLMEDGLLLVALNTTTLKPTIFEYHKGWQISHSAQVVPLHITSPLVTVDYLQCELASSFVQEQLEAHHIGSFRPSITRANLMNLMIRVPSIAEQNRIVRDSKEALSNELIKKLGIENAELRNDRYNEFVREMRVRKHAIGQVLNELSPAIDMLLICKDKNNGVLRGTDIVSKRSGYTVDEYLQKVRSLVNKVVYMVDSLTNEYKPKGEVKEYNVVQLIEEYFKDHSITDGFDVSIKHETFNTDIHVPERIVLPEGDVLEPYDISAGDNMDFWTIEVCKEDFFQVLDNIVSNAKRYGFTENRPDYTIRFEMEDVRDDKQPMVAIHIKNNGNPLPEGIKPEQVFMYGEGSSQGTGIGGWQIKQIVEGMGGRVELRTYENDAAGYTIDYVLTFPDKSVLVLL